MCFGFAFLPITIHHLFSTLPMLRVVILPHDNDVLNGFCSVMCAHNLTDRCSCTTPSQTHHKCLQTQKLVACGAKEIYLYHTTLATFCNCWQPSSALAHNKVLGTKVAFDHYSFSLCMFPNNTKSRYFVSCKNYHPSILTIHIVYFKYIYHRASVFDLLIFNLISTKFINSYITLHQIPCNYKDTNHEFEKYLSHSTMIAQDWWDVLQWTTSQTFMF